MRVYYEVYYRAGLIMRVYYEGVYEGVYYECVL